jgi:hypothetical protein
MTDKENLIISKKLKSNENVLWTGKPNSSSYLNFKNLKKTAVIILILIVMSTFLYTNYLNRLVKTSNLNLMNNNIFLLLTFLTFILLIFVILKLFNSTYLSLYFKSKKLIYVITNIRIFSINYKKKISIHEIPLKSIKKHSISYNINGYGNLLFTDTKVEYNDKNFFINNFINIKDIREIENIIVENFMKKK